LNERLIIALPVADHSTLLILHSNYDVNCLSKGDNQLYSKRVTSDDIVVAVTTPSQHRTNTAVNSDIDKVTTADSSVNDQPFVDVDDVASL
jgi:hypothetical protein